MMKQIARIIGLLVFSPALLAAPQYYLTVYDEAPKYPEHFRHFDYANPDAAKGGQLSLVTQGAAFDHLIPYVAQGQGVDKLDGLLYAPLAQRSKDEPFTVYSYVAQSMELAPDRTWVRFRLNPRARFEDGTAITAQDVRFTFEQLMRSGKLQYRIQLANVKGVTVEGERQVRFDLANTDDRTLPLYLATLPVLPEHWFNTRDLANGAGFEIPPGSGPYRVVKVEPGRSVHLQRVSGWWGADLPVNRGQFNFDRLGIEYFSSSGASAIQALRAGAFDLQGVSSAAQYSNAYNSPALDDGRLQRDRLAPATIRNAQGFFFNLDRPQFADRRVRQALALLWDYEWTSRSLLHDAYKRQRSFFSNSDLAATGLPGAGELRLLEKWRRQVPGEVFTQAYAPPVTDGSGMLRDKQLQALALLEEAGWRPHGKQLVNDAGQPLQFTFLSSSTIFGRLVMPYKRNLMQIGVTLDYRVVDSAQYVNRLRSRDYDMIMASIPVSQTPGAELLNYFGSAAARDPGSNNYMALRDPVVDDLISHILKADNRSAAREGARALDRVLQWGYYWVPNYYPAGSPVVWWNRFGRPVNGLPIDQSTDAWWQISNEPLTNQQMHKRLQEQRHAEL